MTIYHCSVKTHSRTNASTNHAVRSAAYRAGSMLVDTASGNIYNYTRKTEVVFSEIRIPTKTPTRFLKREELWNEVEKSEKRIDAQLFREIEVALPRELTRIQMIDLLRIYLDEYAVKYGMIADFSIHDDGNGNPHAHIMLTMRNIEGDGFGNKNRDWNDKKFLAKWRKGWETCTNKVLKQAGIDERIDSRSYADQGKDCKPTLHEGREGIGGYNKEKVQKRREYNSNTREYNMVRSDIKKQTNQVAELEKLLLEEEMRPSSNLTVIKSKMLNSLSATNSKAPKQKINTLASVFNTIKPDVQIAELTKPKSKLLNLNKRILQSVKPVQESSCRSIVCYESPKAKKSLNSIDHKLAFNLPSNPMDAQACYSLRALFGNDANREYRDRVNVLKAMGLDYTWQDYYIELQRDAKSDLGANHEWWKTIAKMTYHEHNSSLQDIGNYIPDKYKTTFENKITIESKRSNIIPEQPAYAIWKFVKQVEEPKVQDVILTTSKVDKPVIAEPVKVPPRQHVDEVVEVKPSNSYPDPYKIPTVPSTPNPWGSDSFGT